MYLHYIIRKITKYLKNVSNYNSRVNQILYYLIRAIMQLSTQLENVGLVVKRSASILLLKFNESHKCC